MRKAVPGLALAGAGVAASLSAHWAVPELPPLVFCVALGSSSPTACASRRRPCRGSGWLPGPCSSSRRPARLDSCSRTSSPRPQGAARRRRRRRDHVRRDAVAGRRLGISDDLSLLVATGFSICGVSAIAAANGVIERTRTRWRSPSPSSPSAARSRSWCCRRFATHSGSTTSSSGPGIGASVHDVAQVVAPRRPPGRSRSPRDRRQADPCHAPRPLVAGSPWGAGAQTCRPPSRRARLDHARAPFIVAFVGMVAVASLVVVPDGALDGSTPPHRPARMALFALGTRVDVRSPASDRARPLALGLASWLLIAVVSYAGVRLAWPDAYALPHLYDPSTPTRTTEVRRTASPS